MLRKVESTPQVFVHRDKLFRAQVVIYLTPDTLRPQFALSIIVVEPNSFSLSAVLTYLIKLTI